MNKNLRIFAMAVAFVVLTATVLLYVQQQSVRTADAAVITAGSNKEDVKKVQQKLKNWGYYAGSVDGIYGSKTKEAVKKFQQKNSLAVDGIAGPKTLAKMGITMTAATASSGSVSSSDLYLLAKCIYAEARGEPYVGRVAVGAVILNRLKSPDFPNTISGVIYQPYAFTAVNDGQINLTPNDEAMRAAQDALSGWDPTYGCLFYYNPAVATNQWIRQKKIALTIGKHVFCL